MKKIRLVTLKSIGLAVSSVLLAASLSNGVQAAGKQKTNEAIQLLNQSAFSNSAVIDYLLENAPKSHRALLTDKKYALHVFTDYGQLGDGTNYCVAKVGITYAALDGRNSRDPGHVNVGVEKPSKPGKLDKKEIEECQGHALKYAFNNFFKADSKIALNEIDLTLSNGVPQAFAGPNKELSLLVHFGLDKEGAQEVDRTIPKRWSNQFDYRAVALLVKAYANTLPDGTTICWATSSVTAPPPQNRNARISDFMSLGYREIDSESAAKRGEVERCKQDAAVYSVQTLLSNSWDKNGIFKSVERTRKDGIPLPKFNAIRKDVADAQVVRHPGLPTPPAYQVKNCRYVRETVPETKFKEQCEWGPTGPTNCRQEPYTEWKSEDKEVCQ